MQEVKPKSQLLSGIGYSFLQTSSFYGLGFGSYRHFTLLG
jgi:hypothetical protein